MAQTDFYSALTEQLSAQYSVTSFRIQADNACIPSRAIQKDTTTSGCRWSSGPSQQISDNTNLDSSSHHSDTRSPSLPRRSVTPPTGHLYDVMRGGSKPTRPERKSSPKKNDQSSPPTRDKQKPLPRVPRRQITSNKMMPENQKTLAAKYGDLNDSFVSTDSSKKSTKRVSIKEQYSKSWPQPQMSLQDAMVKTFSASNVYDSKVKSHSKKQSPPLTQPLTQQVLKTRPKLSTSPKQSSFRQLATSLRISPKPVGTRNGTGIPMSSVAA